MQKTVETLSRKYIFFNKSRESVKEGREEGRKEGRKEGREEGREEKKREIAKAMKAKGILSDVIASCTGLEEADIEKM